MPFSILNERIDPSPPGPARPGAPATDKARLRRQARTRRHRLDPASRQHAQARVAGHLLDALARYGWRHIGAYAATAAELDLAPFLAAAPAQLRVYLPAIVAPGRMQFRCWPPGSGLVAGPHNILQPPPTCPARAPAQLDAILMPLLAFDRHGTRLGSGGGYYDRLLAFRRQAGPPPCLVGVAFQCQGTTARLPREAWDVPLDALCTETGWRTLSGPA